MPDYEIVEWGEAAVLLRNGMPVAISSNSEGVSLADMNESLEEVLDELRGCKESTAKQ